MIVIEGGRDQDTLLKQLKGMQKYFKFDLEVMESEIPSYIEGSDSVPGGMPENESEPVKRGRKKAV